MSESKPTPTAKLIQTDSPNPLATLLKEYANRPLVGTGAETGRFLGRIVIEVWDKQPNASDDINVACTWALPDDIDPGPIFQHVATYLSRMASKFSELYNKHKRRPEE